MSHGEWHVMECDGMKKKKEKRVRIRNKWPRKRTLRGRTPKSPFSRDARPQPPFRSRWTTPSLAHTSLSSARQTPQKHAHAYAATTSALPPTSSTLATATPLSDAE